MSGAKHSQERPLEAWVMDNVEGDQRLPHKTDPVQMLSAEALASVGVIHWVVPVEEKDPADSEVLQKIRKDRGYNNHDIITVSKEKMGDVYESKIKMFFEEHLHDDEEIRYILDGSGYFDIRGNEDKWYRMLVRKGDMIVLPAGAWHRFTLDENNYIHAMRLFQDEPVWTAHNKSVPANYTRPARSQYAKDEARIEAWIYDESSSEDQRQPHKTNPERPVDIEQLKEVGVLTWKLSPGDYLNDNTLKEIRKQRNYNSMDVVTVSKEIMKDAYEAKMKMFFEEHLHSDEEIRYCLEGSGYFDIRNKKEEWIRIHIKPGDMIVLPAGSFHRYTNDSNNFIKAMRLFQDEPVWTPLPRSDPANAQLEVRKAYCASIA